MTVKEQLVQAVLDLDEHEAICAELAVDQAAVEELEDLENFGRISAKLALRALDEEERATGHEPWQP